MDIDFGKDNSQHLFRRIMHLLVLIIQISGMVKGREYFENRPVLCDITSSICLTACVCALFSIGGISFNRYLNICRPNIYPHVFNLRNNIIMCVSFWCVGLVMALPGLVGWTDNVYDHKMLECIWNRLHSLSYTIFFSSGVVLTPIIIISFSYICIFLHVRASKRKIDSEATHQQKAKKNMAGPVKLAKTLFIIFLIFVSCWGPYALLVVIDFNDKLPHELHLYVLMLAHMHSTLSPIVYAITNIHFRNGYKMILFKVKCVGRNLVNSEQMQYMEKTNSDQTHFNGGQI